MFGSEAMHSWSDGGPDRCDPVAPTQSPLGSDVQIVQPMGPEQFRLGSGSSIGSQQQQHFALPPLFDAPPKTTDDSKMSNNDYKQIAETLLLFYKMPPGK